MAVRHHVLDIYGAHLHLATTRREWSGLRRRIDSLPELHGIGMTSRDITDDGGIHLSVFLDMNLLADNPGAQVEIISHEATHAAGMLLDEIGQEYNGQSEALAYLVGFIAAWLWTGVNP
jgi:hypothetical protein